MHGRMHPNYWQRTILLVVDLCSSLAYFMMTQPLPIASKLPTKTLVARQLPTNQYAWLDIILHRSCTHTYFYSYMHESSSVMVIITHTPYKPNKVTLK